MSNENTKLTKCNTCNADIAKGAKVCVHCGAKVRKPFYKKWWFVAVIVIVIISFFASMGADEDQKEMTEPMEQTEQMQQQIEYTSYTVAQLVDDLENNALSAEEKYSNQYVEITGRLGNVDSDGKYISLYPTNDEFAFMGVQCYIKNDEQKSRVATLSKNDVITVRGKIKSIGEIMGYSLDIDSIQ